MFAPIKIMLLDVGNTSIKYSYFYTGETEKNIKVNAVALSQLNDVVNAVEFVFVCSVRDEAFNRRLAMVLSKTECVFEFIETQKEYRGLTNSYEKVHNMGADRWVGMIGAQYLVGNSFLLVDAGTAITIDAVENLHHLGGWIVAGRGTAKSALLANTDRVFDTDKSLDVLAFGQDTPECVVQGSDAMAIGVVLSALTVLKKRPTPFVIVVSGGDATVITSNLKMIVDNHILETTNVVLVGLAAIANARFLR